jgi:hypothetical protein
MNTRRLVLITLSIMAIIAAIMYRHESAVNATARDLDLVLQQHQQELATVARGDIIIKEHSPMLIVERQAEGNYVWVRYSTGVVTSPELIERVARNVRRIVKVTDPDYHDALMAFALGDDFQ